MDVTPSIKQLAKNVFLYSLCGRQGVCYLEWHTMYGQPLKAVEGRMHRVVLAEFADYWRILDS